MNKTFFILAILMSCASLGFAQTFSEKINKSFSFEKKGSQNAILIYNISGDVEIEGTTGDQIVVEVTKTIRAKTDARLAVGKEDIQLGIMDMADTLILYVKGTGSEFRKNDNNNGKSRHYGWGYQWDKNRDGHDLEFDYTMDFKIKIPMDVHVSASTVNDGDVMVSNTKGQVRAHNVNGHIRLKDIAGGTTAHTINGNVDVDYSKNPTTDCRYYTLNGDIRVNFPTVVSGRMTFKSFNGDLYTNIDPLTPMPAVVNKKETEKGIKYKIESERYQIRTGGPLFDVETFNGDAYLKELVNK